MRDILYRGKRVDNGEWIISDSILQGGDKVFLWAEDSAFVQAIPETVGQYTGLKDRNGKRIFEGDIVKWIDQQFNAYKSKVIYCCDKYNYPAFDLEKHDYECNGLQYAHEDCYLEIIGNITDNPELLEDDAQ